MMENKIKVMKENQYALSSPGTNDRESPLKNPNLS